MVRLKNIVCEQHIVKNEKKKLLIKLYIKSFGDNFFKFLTIF